MENGFWKNNFEFPRDKEENSMFRGFIVPCFRM